MQNFDWIDTYPMYINLDHREDRKEHIKGQLQKVGIKADRVRGVYFQEVDDATNIKYKKMVDNSKNQLGCYIAHINCLQRAFKLKSNAFIFEDDAHLCEDFTDRMEYIEKFLNTHDWDIVWLGGIYNLNATETTDDPRIVRTYGCSSTTGYLVNYDSIPKILYMLEEVLHKSTTIDHSFIMIEPLIKSYAMIPALIKKIDSDNYSKFGAYGYADRMEQVDPLNIVKN